MLYGKKGNERRNKHKKIAYCIDEYIHIKELAVFESSAHSSLLNRSISSESYACHNITLLVF
jgi:hypothetical protein